MRNLINTILLLEEIPDSRKNEYTQELSKLKQIHQDDISMGRATPTQIIQRIKDLEQSLKPRVTPIDPADYDITKGNTPNVSDPNVAAAYHGIKPGGDPVIHNIQVYLNQLGAKLKTDGRMGPRTKAAMEKYRTKVNAYTNGGANKILAQYNQAITQSRLQEDNIPKNAKISASTAPGDVKPEKIGKHVYKRHPSAKARTIKSKLPKTRPIVKSNPQVERDKESFLKSLREEVKDLLNQIRKL